MRKIIYILITTIFALNAWKLNAQNTSSRFDSTSYCIFPVHASILGDIISYEYPTLATDFQIEAIFYFLDTVNVHDLIWQLPEGWSITNPCPTPFVGNQGDSLLLVFTLSIPDTNLLPFYSHVKPYKS